MSEPCLLGRGCKSVLSPNSKTVSMLGNGVQYRHLQYHDIERQQTVMAWSASVLHSVGGQLLSNGVAAAAEGRTMCCISSPANSAAVFDNGQRVI